MLDAKLFMLQRLSALVMVPLVIGHIGVMIYAVQGGLSAGEILARTQGSAVWALFYGVFVIAVSIHAAIGIRVVVHEMSGLRGAALKVLTAAVFIGLAVLGMQAVYSVTVT